MRTLALLVISSAILTCSAFAVGQAGTDLAVLNSGVGARPLSMGGAFVAVADNADAGFWNPAGLANIVSTEVTTMQTRLSSDVDHYYVSYASKLFGGAYSLSWIQLSLGSISKTASTDAFNEVQVLSVFNYFSNAYLFSYGLIVNSALSIGMTAKYLTSDMDSIANGQAYGYSISPGFLLHVTRFSLPVTLGMKIDELVNEQKWGTGTSEKVPPKIRAGISVNNIFLKDTRLAFDVSQILKSSYSADYALGYEFFRDNVSLRAGLVDSGVTAGAGFSSGGASLDYAYVQQASLSRDNVHRVSLSGKW